MKLVNPTHKKPCQRCRLKFPLISQQVFCIQQLIGNTCFDIPAWVVVQQWFFCRGWFRVDLLFNEDSSAGVLCLCLYAWSSIQMPERPDDQQVDSCWSMSWGSAALNAAVSSDQCDGAERRRTGQQCATRVIAVSGKPISAFAKAQPEHILLVSWETLISSVWFIST